ncbi:MAG: hypothetical protein EOO65_05010 [Methanosarcinales archaeon]|nr:MAG: hypothetical protein EOO65_05010 [Methanosarcinales archaeon]
MDVYAQTGQLRIWRGGEFRANKIQSLELYQCQRARHRAHTSYPRQQVSSVCACGATSATLALIALLRVCAASLSVLGLAGGE